MLRKPTLLAALAFVTSAAAADIPPSEPSGVAPDIFVQSLYQTKLESEAVSAEMGRATTDSLILNHFDADLLSLYKSTFYADEPIIDGDVFMMAQEWDTKEVATKTTAQTAEFATVEAIFEIAGEPRKVVYTLKPFKDGWEIDDIATPEGHLREWIREGMAAAEPKPAR
ncbi:MAG: hypothetical protein IT548_16955 [Alphaproteobacteria bacterium]|nr:hypothetical protein [Alphaproteobacteria bacterium]